jgi:hypothetical protein
MAEEGDNYEKSFRLRVIDPVSRTELFDLKVLAPDMGRIMCGGGQVSARVTVHPGRYRGLKKEWFELWVPREKTNPQTIVAAQQYVQLLGAGWDADVTQVGNHHRQGQYRGIECVRVTFWRYVPPETPPVELPAPLMHWRVQ